MKIQTRTRRTIRHALSEREVEEFFAAVNAAREHRRPVDTAERVRLQMLDARPAAAELAAARASVRAALEKLA